MEKDPDPILLVEDDELERLSFELILKKGGFTVASAGSGREALSLLDASSFPVLITDLFLSDCLAFEMIPEIKAHNQNPIVILVTAEMREEYRKKAREIGVHAYLTKPVEPKELFTILRDLTLPSKEV